MMLPSATTKMSDIFYRAKELADKASKRQPWDDAEREELANAVATLALVVQDLVLESKKPAREMPVLPKKAY